MAELKPCPFCEKMDFGAYRAIVNDYTTAISTAGGSYRYPREEQFKFCPECGRSLSNTRAEPEPRALTLEELCKWDGQKVTIIRIKTELVSRLDYNNPEEWIIDITTWNLDRYGKTWLAYDREPKGVQG